MKHEEFAKAVTSLLDVHGLQHTVTPEETCSHVTTTNPQNGLAVTVTFHENGTVEQSEPEQTIDYQALITERDEALKSRAATLQENEELRQQLAVVEPA